MLGEGLKDTCPICATTTATEACPSSLHPSTAPTRGVLRLAVAICCCKEDKSSLTSTSGSANNARLFRRRHVYGWLYSTAFCGRAAGNSRVSGADGPTVGAPMTDQYFHRPVLNWPFFSAITARSFPPAHYHVVPIYPHRFPGCWVVQWLSASREHLTWHHDWAQLHRFEQVHTIHRICTGRVL